METEQDQQFEQYQQAKTQLSELKKQATDWESKYQQLRRQGAIADSLRSAGAHCPDSEAEFFLNHLLGDASESQIPEKITSILQNSLYKQIFFPGQSPTPQVSAKEVQPQRPRFSRKDLLEGRVKNKNAIDLIASGQADVF